MAKASGESLRRLIGSGVLVILLVGCGVSDGLDRLKETIDETLEEADSASTPASGVEVEEPTGDQWALYTNETGSFTVELPAEPEYVEVDQDGLIIGSWSSESKFNAYGIAEYELDPGVTYDFDLGVVGTVDGVVTSIAQQLGESTTYEMIERNAEVRNGVDGVRFVATVAVEDEPYATIHGAVYAADRSVVLSTMIDVDSDDTPDAERFLDSLQLSP